MALGSENPFVREDILPSWWANRMQEFVAASIVASPLRVKSLIVQTPPSSVSVSTVVEGGPGEEAAILSFDGKLRFNEEPVTAPAPPTGASRPLDLFAAAYDNDISLSGDDETDRSWGLVWAEYGETPSSGTGGYDLFRRLCSGLFVTAGVIAGVDVLFAEEPRVELVTEVAFSGGVPVACPMMIDFARIKMLPEVPDGTKIIATKDMVGSPNQQNTMCELVAVTFGLGKYWRPTDTTWFQVDRDYSSIFTESMILSFGELAAGLWQFGFSSSAVNSLSGTAGSVTVHPTQTGSTTSQPIVAYIDHLPVGNRVPVGLAPQDLTVDSSGAPVTIRASVSGQPYNFTFIKGWARPLVLDRA